MAKHWKTVKVTSAIAETSPGEFGEVNVFTIHLTEFDETQQFTIAKGNEDTLVSEIETWLEFRRSIAEG